MTRNLCHFEVECFATTIGCRNLTERSKIAAEGGWLEGRNILYYCDGFLSSDRSATGCRSGMGRRSATSRLNVLDFEKIAVCIGEVVVKP